MIPIYPRRSCDAAQIEQVFLALVDERSRRDAARWQSLDRNQLQPEADQVRIVVRDDGSGIPPEILPRIFEPFLTTKETGRGVGLGLAISHSILERHNGSIEVQSEVGRGTTFTVTLPWHRSPSKIAPPSATEIAAIGSGR